MGKHAFYSVRHIAIFVATVSVGRLIGYVAKAATPRVPAGRNKSYIPVSDTKKHAFIPESLPDRGQRYEKACFLFWGCHLIKLFASLNGSWRACGGPKGGKTGAWRRFGPALKAS